MIEFALAYLILGLVCMIISRLSITNEGEPLTWIQDVFAVVFWPLFLMLILGGMLYMAILKGMFMLFDKFGR